MSSQPSTESSGAAGGAPLQLVALLAVAAALRAYRLDAPLWYDEIVTLVEFVRLTPSDLLTTYHSTNNHLLYSLLAHASVAAGGETAWALRLPAALFGVASLAAFWWMAHALVPAPQARHARQARLASWLVALSYHHVWFSQNARGYTAVLLFCWLGTALYLQARRAEHAKRPRLWLGYAIAMALGAYTHLSALFVFAAHGLVYLAEEAAARRRRPARAFDTGLLTAFAGGLLLTLLLYAPLVSELLATLADQRVAGSGAATVTTWKNPLWTLLEIARGLPLGSASLFVVGAGAATAAVGLASLGRARPFDALLLVLPSVVALAALLTAGFNLWPRYFLVSLGFAAILGVRGVFVIAQSLPGLTDSRRAQQLATAACIAAILLSIATLPRNYRHPKQDYPAARALILASRASQEPVYTLGLADYAYGRYYEPRWAALDSVEQLERLQSEHTRLWIVYSFPMHLRGTRGVLFERVESEFEHVQSFAGTLGDGDVHVLRSRASTDQTARDATGAQR